MNEGQVHPGTPGQQLRVRTCFATGCPQFFMLTNCSGPVVLCNSQSSLALGQSQHQFTMEIDQQWATLFQDELFSTQGSLSQSSISPFNNASAEQNS